MLLFLLTILADLAAVQDVQSELVDGSHVHQWTVVSREVKEREEVTFLDRTPAPNYSDETGEYPTALVRGAEVAREGGIYTVDFMFAVDCGNTAVAITAVWEPGSKVDESLSRFLEPGVFKPADATEKDFAVRDAIFKQACGAQWSYTPSK